MARYETPQYLPPPEGFEIAGHRSHSVIEPPAPLPWVVRHPTLTTALVAVLIFAAAFVASR